MPHLRSAVGGVELAEMDVDAVIAPRARARARRRARAHEPPRGAQPQALRGHRRDPRRRDRRHLDGQHPAPREPQRRGLRADGRARARDVPRPDPRRGRRGRARRSHARGAPGAAAATARSTRRRASTPRSQNFFRLDNLAALRELVLRELAEDVEARRTTAVLDPLSQQAVAERILVLVTPEPRSQRILRRAFRSGQRLGSEIDALWVRRPGAAADRGRRRSRSLRCGGSRAFSARTSSSSRATACRRP